MEGLETVLIVDDHPGFRKHARGLLEGEGYRVVGEAADGESAVEAARALEPRWVLMDVQLPGTDGYELTERIMALSDPPVVVLTSSRDAIECERCARDAGARGFVPKSELSRETIERVLCA